MKDLLILMAVIIIIAPPEKWTNENSASNQENNQAVGALVDQLSQEETTVDNIRSILSTFPILCENTGKF